MNLNYGPMDQQPHVNSNPGKYKTSLCKHYTTQKTCSFGSKCQFAHGKEELRSNGSGISGIGGGGGGGMPPMHHMGMGMPQHHQHHQQHQPYQMEQTKGPNPQNYKIVKCKYWDKDKTCRYGSLCTFAHGDEELRSKSDNAMYNQFDPMGNNPQMQIGMNQPMFQPGVMNPYMMGFDPNMMMGMPNMMDFAQDPKAMNDFFMNMQQGGTMTGGNQIGIGNKQVGTGSVGTGNTNVGVSGNVAGNKGQLDKMDDSNK